MAVEHAVSDDKHEIGEFLVVIFSDDAGRDSEGDESCSTASSERRRHTVTSNTCRSDAIPSITTRATQTAHECSSNSPPPRHRRVMRRNTYRSTGDGDRDV